MIRLGGLVRLLPCPENECDNFPILGNLFIVATHADPSISDHQLQEIPHKAAKRLYNQLDESALNERREQTNRPITEEDLKARFFTFWSEKPDRCQRLFDDLSKTLEKFLPQARISRIQRELQAIKEDNSNIYASQIEAYQNTLADIDLRREQLQTIEDNEPARKKETQHKRNQVQH